MAGAVSVVVLHLLAFLVIGYGVYYHILYVTIPFELLRKGKDMMPEFGGKAKYLTVWNAAIQVAYFGLSIVNHVLGSSTIDTKKMTPMQKFRDIFFASIVFPLAVFVASTFWSLWMIDRELVFPKALDPYYPMWLNHTMHTLILPAALLEMVLVYHKYPSRMRGIAILSAFIWVYISWVFVIAYVTNGHWVYPVLAVLGWGGRLTFMGGLTLFVILLYIVGEKANTVYWGRQVARFEQKRRR